ncbi:MAG TPA: PilZ domain-containing protein [Allosphingosinicella sp.]
MGAVSIYSRDQRTLEADLAGRGHHVVYRAEETNRCPGCGRAQWHVGRQTAECAFCGTAIALAEAKWVGSAKSAAPVETKKGSNRRRHERVPVADRTLQLLIDDSPHEFAIHNLSAGGLMGDAPARLQAGDSVQVRFEGGLLVPATVKWSADGLIGLAFDSRVLFDTAGVA